MQDTKPLSKEVPVIDQLIRLIGWIVGILLALAVGSALVANTLALPFVSQMIQVVLGWLIILLTLLGAVLSFAARE